MSAFIFLCVAAGLWNPTPSGGIVLGPETVRTIAFEDEFRLTADGKGAEGIARGETTFALPSDEPGQRILAGPDDLPTGAGVRLDLHKNRLAVLSVAPFDPAAGLRTAWSVRVALADREHKVRPEALLGRTAIPPDVLSRYLFLDGRHETGDGELARIAAEAARASRDPADLAFRLNELVRERVTYVRDGRWDPAPIVWRTGRGSCSEYHFLYATLCRMAGLPCRFVGATAWRGKDGEATYEDTVYHRWSEVYLAGYGWFPVDVSRNDGEDGEPVNRAFGRTSAALLILSRGEGGVSDAMGVQYVARSQTYDAKGRPVDSDGLRSDRAIRWTNAPTTP